MNTDTPVMSDGRRSGWPWTRDSSAPREVARVRASTVLPTPGTSSMRRWPPERAATAAATSAPSLPSTTCSRLRTSARPSATASSRSRTRSSTTLIGTPPCRGPRVPTLRVPHGPPVPGLTLRQAGSGCAGAPSRAEPSPLRRSWGPGPEAIAPELRRQLRVEVVRPPGGRGGIHPADDEVNRAAVDERAA